MPFVLEFVSIDSCPLPLMVAVVPADKVPLETAVATAACNVAMVSPAFALKVIVSPVVASLMVVTDPAFNDVVVARGVAVDPFAEV